jgi:hypothetical protein
MKNITLSAEEHLIEQARAQARRQRTTLNALFRDWLKGVAEADSRSEEIQSLLRRLERVDSGGPFSREEMNER